MKLTKAIVGAALILMPLLLAAPIAASQTAKPFAAVGAAAPAASPYSVGGPRPAPEVSYISMTFPVDSIVIPFDNKQTNVIKAFGFVHALLRNNSIIHRIIGPPDAFLYTTSFPAGDNYSGGPIVVLPQDQAIVDLVKPHYSSVSYTKLTQSHNSSKVFMIDTPTRILVIKGLWGETHLLLEDMGIPYILAQPYDIQVNPAIMLDYSLVVDDCGSFLIGYTDSITENFTRFVNEGNELIFTDWSMSHFQKCPWGYMMGVTAPFAASETIEVDFHSISDFPGQYYGKDKVKIYEYVEAVMGADPVDPNVKIMADMQTYQNVSEHRIAAAYFYWGPKNGIVEFFSYHPQEQTLAHTGDPDSYKLASFLYGNKFLHSAPLDAGMTIKHMVSPTTIRAQGTSGDPSQEQAKVTVSMKAVGVNMITGNNIRLHYETMPGVQVVAGSYKGKTGMDLPPDTSVSNPNGTVSMDWSVMEIPVGDTWNVSFNVSCTQAGKAYISTSGTYVSYKDAGGSLRIPKLLPLYVTVLGPGASEWVVPAVLAACAVSVAAVAALRLRRRR